MDIHFRVSSFGDIDNARGIGYKYEYSNRGEASSMVSKRAERRSSRRFTHFQKIRFVPLSSRDHLLNDTSRQGYIDNICKNGLRMRIRGEMLHEGSFITIRMPVTEKKTTVPALAEVRWVKEQKPGDYHIGLRYMMQ